MRFFVIGMTAAMSAACPAFAQTADAEAASDDQIIVTGTREISRTQFESISPVDILSGTAIDSSISSDLSDTLAQLLPSFNVQRLPAADGLAFVRPATLRGLSPDQTLVLINGKRYHRSALLGSRGAQAPDLATIPALSIGRVEVLRDGASAQYGSDAIAGVINIILDDKPGMKLTSQYSQYDQGDGKNYQVAGQGGIAFGDRGSLVLTGEFSKSDATSRTRQRPDAIAFQAANLSLRVPNPVQRWGQPDLETVRGSINGRFEYSDAVETYVALTVGEGEGVTDFNWRNPSNTGSAFNPSTAFPGFNLRTIYPTGFTPRFGTRYSDIQTVGGVRGEMSESFTYDLSISGGRNRTNYTLAEAINASLGPQSPTSFYLGRLEQSELNINADFVYRLPIGVVDPLNIAFGVERRKESYKITAGDPASYAVGPGAATGLAPNANGFPGFSDIQAGVFSQESYAGYLDLEAKPAESITLAAAGRYEDFSGFGGKFTYKGSARFEPFTGLALRAAYSTGFRAPTPGQINSSSTTQGLDTVTLQIFNAGRLSPTDPIARALGAVPLKPETSKTASAGLALQTGFGLGATIDIFEIKVKDRFGQSRAFAVPAALPNPLRFTSVSYFTNDFATRTRGIDVIVNFKTDISIGKLTTDLAYNYTQTKVTSGNTAAIANDTQRRIFQERLPQHNATGSIDFENGPVNLTLRGRYYGPWTDSSGNATGDIFQRFGSITLFDAALAYKIGKHFSLKVGAENIFNTFPDEATFQSVRGLIYSRNAPYDTDGAQYYVRAGISF